MLKGKTSIVCIFIVSALNVCMSCGCQKVNGWRWERKLDKELKLMGHRNWIVVADSAYPAQNRAGIDTIVVGGDQLEAVKTVLAAIDEAEHVQAKIYLDKELDSVTDTDAPGIHIYRQELKKLLEGREPISIEHEELIANLDEAAKVFKILIIKTDMILPYTTVFFELDCGYWNADAEKRLREKIGQ
ncbi:MAG: RbsD/FucU domain-containing protein [Planctomycetota bacterium]|jgi:L-fucose mutarotase/ribose pyranase (RbsD/FucU family)